VLTDFREGLTVILAGQPGQLRLFLDTSPVLAFRFPAIIEFPGYTATELDGIFAVLGGEAGFTLTSAADRKAATVRGQVNSGRGSTRPAIRLLQRATANQARRVAAADQPAAPAALGVIDPADIPHHLALCRPGRPEGTAKRPGRWAWALFAGSVGVAGTAEVPLPIVLLVIPVTLLLASLLAAGPGWAAARMSPTAALRAE
jgi:hypothetical protein